MQLENYALLAGGAAVALGIPFFRKTVGAQIVPMGVCGSQTDVAQGETADMTISVRNTGTLSTKFGIQTAIKDSGGTVVETVCTDTAFEVDPDVKATVTPDVTIPSDAQKGAADVTVTVYANTGCEGDIEAQKVCSGLINIVSGVAAEITSISVS